MKIWVDADASPQEMKDIVFRAARRLELPVALVANRNLLIPAAYPNAISVCVTGGPDAADHYIVEHAQAGDVAVTADIELAARLVGKQVAAIDPRGAEYTEDNAGARLSVRNFMEGLRGAGVITSGPRPYGPREKQAFAATLDRVLTRLLRKSRET